MRIKSLFACAIMILVLLTGVFAADADSADRRSSLYVSGKSSASVEIEGETLLLTVDGRLFRMRAVESSSGARYEVPGDPSTFFCGKGEGATISVRGWIYPLFTLRKEPEQPPPGAPFPTGADWRVESIGGRDVLANSTVTMRFDSGGRLFGKASVNSYTSSWLAEGGRILVVRAASTMMAGPDKLMEQENRFLRVLAEVHRYKLERDKLILTAPDGRSIVAVRQ